MTKISVVASLHGTEPYGTKVLDMIPEGIDKHIGNGPALKEGRRFLDVDMNRCFPGRKDGNREEVLARNLLEKVRDSDFLIDLHSSSNDCPIFGIITNPNEEKVEFARKMGLKRLVVMSPSFASGRALIDHVKCGISLEVGPHNRAENASEAADLIWNFLEEKNYSDDMQLLEVFAVIEKKNPEVTIKNFDEVKIGQTMTRGEGVQKSEMEFTAVLVNEEAYGDVLCLACRKI